MIGDPRITSYIDRAAPFAQPILMHLRARLGAACPDVEETIKWGMPNFGYHGRILCNMAAFKQHATFGFWQGKRVIDDDISRDETSAMGQFGRLTSLADLPGDEVLHGLILKAMALIDEGKTAARPVKHAKPPVLPQDDFMAALDANPMAAKVFEAFTPGQRREYVDWIGEAKRPETRQKRIAQSIEWLSEGKRRNWKYENC
jgi:uncharacterized protein YdeI (YjbR/CyaY-like superfamily)